jgi:hypothetical protein
MGMKHLWYIDKFLKVLLLRNTTALLRAGYVIDVHISRTPEEGTNSPSWPNMLLLLLC